jgi:chemotaxis protein MotB
MARHMGRRKKSELPENSDRWLVSYADFITLLFAFFTVLYATSQKDLLKEKQFENSIRSAFKVLFQMGGASGSGPLPDFDAGTDVIAPPIPMFINPKMSAGELQNVIQSRLKKTLSEEEYQSTIQSVQHDSVGAKVVLASSSLFALGSSRLNEDKLSVMDRVLKTLKDSNQRIIVEGHTDNSPIRSGPYATNWDLASARAIMIVRYLSSRIGIDPQRLVAMSYGEFKPLAPNDTEENREKNRRIEILVISNLPNQK